VDPCRFSAHFRFSRGTLPHRRGLVTHIRRRAQMRASADELSGVSAHFAAEKLHGWMSCFVRDIHASFSF
jgi:hypothetical protein